MTKKEEQLKLDIEFLKLGKKCMDSFYFFFTTFWDCMSGETYQDAKHIEYICDTLQYWGMKVIKRERLMKTICISVPPGSSKSTIVTIAFTNWCWLHAPNLATANISYSATLSQQHSYKARAITESKKWHLLFDNIYKIKHGKPLEIIKQNQTEMLNNFKGQRFCTSVGGTILGMHADIFCKDDLISAEQANSDVEREKANRWNDETTSSRRKVPDCYLDIYISQRLHEDDSIGHVLKKNLDVTYICLPSEVTDLNRKNVSPPEAIDLYTDGILDPKRRPKEVLDVLREEMGPNGYAGQYLQVPFNIDEMDVVPAMFRYINRKELPHDVVWDVFIDAAYTDKKSENDPTGVDIMARIGNDIVVKESFSLWKKLPDLIKFLKELGAGGVFDPKRSRIYIEPKASGISLAQYIESDTDFNYVLIGQDNKSQAKLIQGGKRARHEMIKPKAESRRIILVEDKWNEQYVHEICGFPKVSHDERVDNLGYAINTYFHNDQTFVDQWALDHLEKTITDHFNVELTSQEVPARNGKTSLSVTYEDNDSGDIMMFDYPNAQYNNRYIVTVVMRSEAERNANTVILVFDRNSSTISAMYIKDIINPRQVAKKALELAYLYDNARLVVAVKNDTGTVQDEGSDLGHMILRELRSAKYKNLHLELKNNDIRKKKEKEYGFEVTRSTSREIYLNLKDKAETRKISSLPVQVYEDISLLERKRETGVIDGQDGREVNSALAYAICLKISDDWSSKVSVKKSKSNRWH